LKLSETYEPFVGWFRESELRHGRTAMLAVMGFIATDFVRIPGDMYSFAAIPNTIDAHDALLKTGPMYQLLLWIGLFDVVITAPAIQAMGEGEREPGGTSWLAYYIEIYILCVCLSLYHSNDGFPHSSICLFSLAIDETTQKTLVGRGLVLPPRKVWT
jgi:Chlorophyll A-B binding protein